MKHVSHLLIVLFVSSSLFFFSCSKKKDNPENLLATDFISNLHGGRYAFTFDDGPDKWRLIKTSKSGSNYIGISRLQSSTSVTLQQRLDDDDEQEIKWYVNRQNTKLNVPDGSKFLVSIHNAANKNFYWVVVQGGNVNGQPELRLDMQKYNGQFPTIDQAGAIPDVADDAKFYAREKEIGGKKYYQFESLKYPGFFIVNKGHTNSANGILIQLNTISKPADIVANKL